jgi:hypothetical protein
MKPNENRVVLNALELRFALFLMFLFGFGFALMILV